VVIRTATCAYISAIIACGAAITANYFNTISRNRRILTITINTLTGGLRSKKSGCYTSQA